jgi:hypothetical protein
VTLTGVCRSSHGTPGAGLPGAPAAGRRHNDRLSDDSPEWRTGRHGTGSRRDGCATMAAGRAVGAPLTGVRPGFAMGYRLTSGPRLSYHQPRPVTRTGSAYSQSIEPPNNTAQTSVLTPILR